MNKFVLLACVGLAACSGNDPTRPSAPESSVLPSAKHAADPPMYLALGDSISMGFNPFIDAHNAQAYVGFPEYVQELIDMPHTNAGCYGETTSSFMSPTAPDRGCRALKAAGLVRAGYTGTQMEFMIDFIQSHPRLRLITIELGENDMLLTAEGCDSDPQCISDALPDTFQTMASNLATIFGTIRGLGYTGQIVVPLYYDAFPTVFPAWSPLTAANNAILTQIAGAFGAQTVDVNSAFVAASADAGGDPCTAGLLIPLAGWNEWVVTAPGAACDSHTTPAGTQLIADTIAQVVPPRSE